MSTCNLSRVAHQRNCERVYAQVVRELAELRAELASTVTGYSWGPDANDTPVSFASRRDRRLVREVGEIYAELAGDYSHCPRVTNFQWPSFENADINYQPTQEEQYEASGAAAEDRARERIAEIEFELAARRVLRRVVSSTPRSRSRRRAPRRVGVRVARTSSGTAGPEPPPGGDEPPGSPLDSSSHRRAASASPVAASAHDAPSLDQPAATIPERTLDADVRARGAVTLHSLAGALHREAELHFSPEHQARAAGSSTARPTQKEIANV